MAFRLKIEDDGNTDFTPWYEESGNLAAPTIAAKIRAAHPQGKISIERGVIDGALPLDTRGLNELLQQKRRASGWSDAEIATGHKYVLDDKGICQICRQTHE